MVDSMVVGMSVCDQFPKVEERVSRWFPNEKDMVWKFFSKMRDGCDLLSKWGGVWIRQVSNKDGWLEEFKCWRKCVGLMSKWGGV